MDIFSYDIDFTNEKLIPPLLRRPIRLAWLRTLTYPMKVKYDYIFGTESYKKGFSCAIWDVLTTYAVGDRVRFGISVYEALEATTGVVPSSDDTKWLLIEKDFVGTDERVFYNAGKMLFEYVLNLYLNPYPTLIYISNNTVDPATFFIGEGLDLSRQAFVGVDVNQTDFVGLSYNLNENCYTIYVPIATANALTSETADVAPNISTKREAIVRGVADKYNLAGMKYNVITF